MWSKMTLGTPKDKGERWSTRVAGLFRARARTAFLIQLCAGVHRDCHLRGLAREIGDSPGNVWLSCFSWARGATRINGNKQTSFSTG